MKWTLRIAGALLVATGAVWTLQGVGMLGGSPMTGDRTWAVVGPVVAVVGLVLIGLGLRRVR
jgi:hypothetical protein